MYERRLLWRLIVATNVLILSGCGIRSGEALSLEAESEVAENATSFSESAGERAPSHSRLDADEEKTKDESEIIENTTDDSAENIDTFSYSDLATKKFCFESGAGGWRTYMFIDANGYFSGDYIDGDLGESGTGYPNGTTYFCNFTGKFSVPEKVDEDTYMVSIENLTYENPVGEEEIKDGTRYVATGAYGLEDGANFYFLAPGKSLEGLTEMESMFIRNGYCYLEDDTEEESDPATRGLPFYVFWNRDKEFMFYSYDVVDYLGIRSKHMSAQADNDDLLQFNSSDYAYLSDDAWMVLKNMIGSEAESLCSDQKEWAAEFHKQYNAANPDYKKLYDTAKERFDTVYGLCLEHSGKR